MSSLCYRSKERHCQHVCLSDKHRGGARGMMRKVVLLLWEKWECGLERDSRWMWLAPGKHELGFCSGNGCSVAWDTLV